MKDEKLDRFPKKNKDYQLLLGALFAFTLFYLYVNVYTINALVVKYFISKGVLSFCMRNLIPILIVVLVGLMFKKKMIKTRDNRMVKIYVTWLCSLFIYFILYHFQFRKTVSISLRKPYSIGASREPEFLVKFIEPLFYPLTIAVILYLLVLGFRKTETNDI